MDKSHREIEDSTGMAEAFRVEIVKLLKAKLPTKESREEFAVQLGNSPHTIHELVRRGRGSFDLIVTVFAALFDIQPESLPRVLSLIEGVKERDTQTDLLNARWRDLPIDNKTRLQLIETVEMILRLERS